MKRKQFVIRSFSALLAVAMVLTILPKMSIFAIETGSQGNGTTVIKSDQATIIEAEDWMEGGQDVAYHEKSYEDADVYKHPNAQRPTDPADSSKWVPQTKDSGSGGYHVSYATDPEWIKYKVTVQAEGDYLVSINCARGYDGGDLTLSVDGGASVTIPYTARTAADWTFGMTEGEFALHLAAGEQILKLAINWPWDIDYIELTPVVAEDDDSHAIGSEGATKIEAEEWMAGGQGVAYHESTYQTEDVYKHPNGQRPADPADTTKYVPQTKEGGSGGYIVSYATDPEWLKYKLNVATEGDYLVAIKCARGFDNGSLTVSVDGGASVTIPHTARAEGNWAMGLTEGEYVLHLAAGEQILKLAINWPWDIDYIELTPVVAEDDDSHAIGSEGATKIEAEEWMAGGQGVAYHESTYQTEDVYKHPNGQRPADPADTTKYVPQTKEGGSGGYIVSYATDPEWLKYKLNVATEGDYLVAIKCARGFDNGSLTVSVDGGASVTIPHTARAEGNWAMGLTEGEYVLHLAAGEQILKLAINWPWDIDYIELTPVAADDDEPVPGDMDTEPVTTINPDTASKIEAENWMNGGPGVAYHEKSYEDADVYKHPRAPRPTSTTDTSKFVPQTKLDTEDNYIVSYIQDPDWMAYKINVTQAGTYRFSARFGSNWDQGTITFYLDGSSSALATINASALPSFDWIMALAEGGTAALPAGEHVLKVVFFGVYDLDYIELTPVEVEDDEENTGNVIKGEGVSKIEAENWMEGGQGVAYHEKSYEDADVYKHPNAQRPADPEDTTKYVPQTKDSGSGGYHVSYATDPEWIKYKVTVEEEGDYAVAIYCARGYEGGGLTISVDGGDSVTIPYTAREEANWAFGMTEGLYFIHLTAGEHILKMDISWPWDIDYIQFAPANELDQGKPGDILPEPNTEISNTGSTRLEAENWMNGGQGIAFNETTYQPENVYAHPRAPRPTSTTDTTQFVPQTKVNPAGGYFVSYATNPEWLKYKITVQSDGDYAIAVNCARGYDGGNLTISVDGGSSVTIPYTARTANDWTLGMTEGEYILHLTAGEHILRLDIDWPWDVDYIEFTPVSVYVPEHPGDLATEPVTTIIPEGISKIEAENWMNGGPGVAFEDDDYTTADTYQHPRAPRPISNSNLVPQTRFVGDNNYIVTHIQDPDWMAYKINVTEAGTYRFSAMCGSTWSPGNISFYLDDNETALATISASTLPTFDWALSLALGGVAELPAGEHVLKVVFFGVYDLDYIQIEPYDATGGNEEEGPTTVITGEGVERLEAEDWMEGGQGVAYQEVNYVTSYDEEHWRYAYDHPRAPKPSVNDPLVYVPQTFKLVDRFYINGVEQNLPDDQGEYVLSYTEEPEWIKYRIYVEKAGTYQVDAMACTEYDSIIMCIYDGEEEVAIINTINNGWDYYNLCEGDQYYFTEGEHILTVKFFGGSDTNYFQFKWLSSEPPAEDEDNGPVSPEEEENLPELDGPITVDKNALKVELDDSSKTMNLPRANVTVYEVLYALYLEDGITLKFFDSNGKEIKDLETALTAGMKMVAYRNGKEFASYSVVVPTAESPDDSVVTPPSDDVVDPIPDTGDAYDVMIASMIAVVSLFVLVLLASPRGRKERTI